MNQFSSTVLGTHKYERTEGGKIVGYKFLHNTRMGIIRSPYVWNFIWEMGKEKVSSRKQKELYYMEYEFKEVHEGFHFYCTLKEAYFRASEYTDICEKYDNIVLAKFEISPEHFIIGDKKEFVTMKATLVEVIEIKEYLKKLGSPKDKC